ncbi:MAG: prepilin-type N-terminal cleavage/methylation domain-containing protein [Bacillota bacterium]
MRKMIRDTAAGYTLIELLIAVTILALVVSPLLGLLAAGFSAINLAGQQTSAVNLCRAALESTKALGYTAVYNLYVREGRSPLEDNAIPGFPQFRRLTVVKPVSLEAGGAPLAIELLLIRITVSWTGKGMERSTILESYLAER